FLEKITFMSSSYNVFYYTVFTVNPEEPQRLGDELTVIEEIDHWKSPLLGISFVLTPEGLNVYYPDGEPFLTTVELAQKAESEKQRAEFEKQRADRLAAQLKSLGVDPNEIC
ncbi:MAG: hypothetical protein ACKO2V_07380, partial [Snowella sp.]